MRFLSFLVTFMLLPPLNPASQPASPAPTGDAPLQIGHALAADHDHIASLPRTEYPSDDQRPLARHPE